MKKLLVVPLLAAVMLQPLTNAHVVTPADPLQDFLRGEPPLIKPKAGAEPLISSSECRLEEFTSAEDEALLELISSVPVECMDDWFFENMPVSLSDVFSEQNMIYITSAAVQRAGEYDSAEGRSGLAGKLYVFLYAGYWNHIKHNAYPDYGRQVRSEIISALQVFIENEYFYDEGGGHTSMLRTITKFVTSLTISERESLFFLNFARLLGSRRAYTQSDEEWGLVSDILIFLRWSIYYASLTYGGDYSSSFESSMIDLVEVLVDIGISDRMHNSYAGEKFALLAFSLGNILYYFSADFPAERPDLLSALKTNLRKLVNYWEGFKEVPAGSSENRYYRSIGILAQWYKRNHTHLTNLREEFLRKIFPAKYSCSTYVVRSQHDSREYMEDVCRVLTDQEDLFHSVLDTNEKPVLNNTNESIEIIIFLHSNRLKANNVFAADLRHSSGVYIGRNAADRCFVGKAVVAVSDHFPLNFSAKLRLRHELIHHLDFRYNGHGRGAWTEGIANYLALKNDGQSSIDHTRKNSITLSLALRQGGYNDAYAAVRFMFERHPEDVSKWIDCFWRDNYSQCHKDFLSSIGSSYDSEFASWLENARVHDGPLPRITRKPRPGVGPTIVPLMMSASESMRQGFMRQGFIRIINQSNQSGSVRIIAYDDGGDAANPVEIQLEANQAFHFNSGDLENGNANKGINAGIGSPVQGDWRLNVETELDVRVLSFVRTTDGFLTAMHDVLPRNADGRLAAQTFNPASNLSQVSSLRLVNLGTNAEDVSIQGVDDHGDERRTVSLTLAAGEARTLSAQQLEGGARGLTGTLGDGDGKWRLFIDAGQSVVGVSLLQAPTGHVTNISTGKPASTAVPLMMSASDSMRQGFVRIINESDEYGGVRILAYDDGGNAASPVEIQLEANQAFHFNAGDLEDGNAIKGINEGVGSPVQGDWRLNIETELDVRTLSFIRTTDGFLTAMHDVLPRNADGRLAAYTFNPGQNRNQVSSLRLVNIGANAEDVSIQGVDDHGDASGTVSLRLAAGEARTLSAQQLEDGAQGLTGTLGDGAGKWRLFIDAGQSVVGVSLLEAPTGHVTNISTSGGHRGPVATHLPCLK